ncbi:MAG: PAS-domain containing protein [Silicimonas sp.]|nr:PAS-domain containing protein [Silicimonas sp.]
MIATPEATADAVHILEGLEYLDQGITIFDQDLKMVAWNRKFLELYGYPDGMAYRGASFDSFIEHNAKRGEYGPGDVAEQVRERVELAKKFIPHRIERRIRDGRTITVAGNPMPNGGFVATYTDTTDYTKRAEELQREIEDRSELLKQTEHRLHLIADEVPAGIAHVDANMTFLYMNKRFGRAYQIDPQEAVGLNCYDVLFEKTLEESSRYFEQARQGRSVDFEMRLELPDGRMKDVRTLLRPEKPASGEVMGFYLVSIDVTRRKSTLNALMRSQKMDALGRMASGISHDFNNLLTIILGNLVPLSEELPGDVVEEFVTPSISAAKRGSALTRRLVTLARREQFDPVPTDIGAATSEITRLLESSVPKSLRIEVQQESDLPQAMVDRSQLEMALLNLTLNARDATEGAGQVTIRTDLYEMTPEVSDMTRLPIGSYVRIRVTDDGCGMSAERTEKIFEPFFTSKAAGAGSGLGLSMVYGFVQQSNGAIFVDSRLDKGSTFTILLPSVELNATRSTSSERRDSQPIPDQPEQMTGLALLVEDDADVRRTVRRKIAALGLGVVEAGDADEALSLVDRLQEISVVVSDIDMPGTMDGIGLARRLQKKHKHIKMILMSGKVDAGAGDKMPRGVPFLQKPFKPEELQRVLGGTERVKDA